MNHTTNYDTEIFSLIEQEKKRLSEGLELIPSENYTSQAVLDALGSVLTNKYSEGYPGKRYYGGNQYIDQIESITQERAKKLFNAEHVNVQPYSGSPANFEVYSALAGINGKILAMKLDMGGHLTHGHKITFSGKYFQFSHYPVDPKTHLIDYDEVRRLAKEHNPKIIVSGASAYPRQIDFKQFHEIAQEIGAISMADISHISGLIAANEHPSPFPFTDVVTTTTHKTLRGPRGAMILCKNEFAKAIDSSVFPGFQGGPHNNTIAGIGVALHEASTSEFKNYARQIVLNAKALADNLMDEGFNLVSGGTDNHLILIDLTNKNITGKQAETALDESAITVNKNAIPYDLRSPLDPSGIRIGTPFITTRGLKTNDMKDVARWISVVINNHTNTEIKSKVKAEILEMCKKYPL